MTHLRNVSIPRCVLEGGGAFSRGVGSDGGGGDRRKNCTCVMIALMCYREAGVFAKEGALVERVFIVAVVFTVLYYALLYCAVL